MYEQFQNIMKMGPFSQILVSYPQNNLNQNLSFIYFISIIYFIRNFTNFCCKLKTALKVVLVCALPFSEKVKCVAYCGK